MRELAAEHKAIRTPKYEAQMINWFMLSRDVAMSSLVERFEMHDVLAQEGGSLFLDARLELEAEPDIECMFNHLD